MSELSDIVVGEAIAAYNRGLSDGQEIERQNILDMLEQEDSACADWAIVLIKGEQK